MSKKFPYHYHVVFNWKSSAGSGQGTMIVDSNHKPTNSEVLKRWKTYIEETAIEGEGRNVAIMNWKRLAWWMP